jgi:hypothetical protein
MKIYKSKILSVVLYVCENWCLILGEEHRSRVPDNSMLRRIFGPKGKEVAEGW